MILFQLLFIATLSLGILIFPVHFYSKPNVHVFVLLFLSTFLISPSLCELGALSLQALKG